MAIIVNDGKTAGVWDGRTMTTIPLAEASTFNDGYCCTQFYDNVRVTMHHFTSPSNTCDCGLDVWPEDDSDPDD